MQLVKGSKDRPRVAMTQEEPRFLSIKNWNKYQRNKAGNVTASGESARYIKMWTDRDSDPDYSRLTGFQRYVLDGCCRLRGRFGKNLPNDTIWVSRALCILSVERHCVPRTIAVLLERGFLVQANQQIDSPEVPLEEKIREEAEKKVQAPAELSTTKAKRNGFVKPDLGFVQVYMVEQQFCDPENSAKKFLAYYESNGWRVGRNPMKDWKAAVRTWKQNDRQKRGLFNVTELTPEEADAGADQLDEANQRRPQYRSAR
jgi:hypothetical protein